MIKRLSNWWHGQMYFVDGVYPGRKFKRHWSSEILHSIFEHFLQHSTFYKKNITLYFIVGVISYLINFL